MRHLVRSWQIYSVQVVGDILGMRYFGDVIQALAAEPARPGILYGVSANLSWERLQALHRAGIRRVQLGIGSLSATC